MEGYVRKLVWLAGVLAVSACNTPSNTNLPPVSLAGRWAGSLSSADTTLGSLRLPLVAVSGYGAGPGGTVDGWTMAGSWSMSLASAADSGTVAGDGTDGSLTVHFKWKGASGCVIDLHGSRLGPALTGVHSASACAVPESGNFTVTQQ